MTSTTLNSIGLFLDIVGALLLFKFGLPSDLNKNGYIYKVMEQTDFEAVNKYKKYNFWSKIALSLIVIGFILQITSNHIKN